MGLTTSLYTGLTGLTSNSEGITVTGNNIANVNTTGFKYSRISFETQVSQNLGSASAPSAELGGTNPTQLGLGTRIAGIDRVFTNGSIQPTGVNTDVAVEGNGFFVVNDNGTQRYTRDGTFKLDRDHNLVTAKGARVQGYGIDDDFNIVTGPLVDINIPLGSLTVAEPTTSVSFSGNLNADGDVASLNSVTTSGPLFSDAGATTPATAGTALTSLFDSSGTALFATSDVITLTGATKGGATVPNRTFEVGTTTSAPDDSGTTLQDFLDFIDEVMGIDSTADAGAGVAVNGAGEIVITGNTGTANDLQIDAGNVVVNQSTSPSLPFTFSKTQDGDGESIRTTFVAYDSLGAEMVLDLTLVLESTTNAGSTWRFYAQSVDDTDLDRVVGTGTLDFDTNGQLISTSGGGINIDRDGTGATTPQTVTLDFGGGGLGAVSSLADTSSQIAAFSQDGSPIGTLEDFEVTEDGRIVGVFSNSILRDLGQIPLALFTNNLGLKEIAGNMFEATSNSGTATIVQAGTGGTGRTLGGALELSNVELSREFINLITFSTGYSASSRVLTTADRMVQELLAAVR